MPTKMQLEKASWQWTETTCPDNILAEHIQLAYRVGLPVCQRSICRRNCKGNPNCLVGLGEKDWLCEISDDHWHELDDPNLERRPQNAFVGLKNLGATCYVNTFLQVWFHNHNFRTAMYKWQPQLGAYSDSFADLKKENYKPDCICGHLQLLFAMLQFSQRRYIDPSGLVNCLGLDAALQQDAQEFSKLFMSLLEEKLSLQSHPNVQNVIQQQFCGQYAYVTRCNNCGHSSECPSKFYELDLNIKGLKELDDSLGEFLQEEHLDGANQYFCDVCKSKQNATRRIQLLQLPPVLNIQLLRFIFDRQTGTKKKLSSFIQFPEILDMTPYLQHNDTKTVYELTAVLIHRGPTAYSGHYVAHVREEGAWHKFNDEEVQRIEGKNLKLGSEDDLHESGPKKGKRPKYIKGFHASRNAYMLVYKNRPDDSKTVSTTEIHTASLAEEALPEYLADLVRADNKQFEEWVEDMTSMRNKSIACGKARHKEITQLFLMLEPKQDAAYEWLHSDWLKQWLNADGNTTCKPIDNQDIVCRHGNLDPNKLHGVKRISQEAADVFYLKYGGGPRLTASNLCLQCVKERCYLMRLKSNLNEDCKFISNATKNKLHAGMPGYWVGKASLRNWRRKVLIKEHCGTSLHDHLKEEDFQRLEETSDFADCKDMKDSFNGELLCPHNNLSTDVSLRKMVPVEVWQRLHTYFPDSPAFNQDEEVCQTCQASDDKERQDCVLRVMMASEQKTSLSQLLNNKHRPSFDKEDVSEAYVVNQPFLEQWREFVHHPLKKSPQNEVNNALLLCHHQRLLIEPFFLDSVQMYSLVWPHEWDILAQHFCVDYTIRIYREQHSSGNSKHQVLKSKPESCSECITAQESQDKLQRQQFSGARIYVRKIVSQLTTLSQSSSEQGKSQPGHMINNDPDFFQVNGNKKIKLSSHADNVRRSSRHRKVRGEKELIVSSTNTLKELKIKVMHAFSVAPFDQTLSLDGQQLLDNDSSLSSLGIEPGCILTLSVDMPQGEDFLEMDEIYHASNIPEAGFKGTGLIGGGT